MISERVFAVLSGDSTLQDSIKAIRPIVLKQSDEMPALTYQIKADHDRTFEGNSGLVKATLEINVYAEKLETAQSINREMKTAIKDVSGVATGITVFNIFTLREIEDHDPEKNEFRINTQFTVNFKEG